METETVTDKKRPGRRRSDVFSGRCLMSVGEVYTVPIVQLLYFCATNTSSCAFLIVKNHLLFKNLID